MKIVSNVDAQLSREAGRHENWLTANKCTNREKYDYIKEMGVQEYFENFQRMRSELGDIYYEIKLKKNYSMAEFYRLFMSEDYSSDRSFMVCLSDMAFRDNIVTPQLPRYRKMEKVIKCYEDYKDIKERLQDES